MKAQKTRMLRRLLGRASLAALLWLLVTSMARGIDSPPAWVDIYGTNSSYDGQPLLVGAVVTALDPQGTECGKVVVDTAGVYGLLPCLGDDGSTAIDEGAVSGDELHFTINGLAATTRAVTLNATPVPPDTAVVWNGHGNRWEVDLVSPPPGCSRYDSNCDYKINTVDIMGVASRWGCACSDGCYEGFYDLDGDCDIDIVDIMAIASRWSCEYGDACYE
ncbi:MAG TPA: hypothetical protein VM537_00980 [Anaerolineae bacterium]|nr:hypothetical protein [Anaerolineae bacterium]